MPPKPTQTPDPTRGKKPRRDDPDLNDDVDSVDGGMTSPRQDDGALASLIRSASQGGALSDQRVRSLMLGVVPCFNLALQECYSSAVTSLGTSNDHVSLEELRPEELPLLLKHGGHIRLLALRMLESLGKILRTPDVEASQKSAARAAIEAAVDHTSLERHVLAKRAKDLGSAAQLVCLINLALMWCLVLLG